MKRQHRSYWFKHFQNWEETSLKKIEYAQEHKLSRSAFYYWVMKFSKENKDHLPLEKHGFEEVSVVTGKVEPICSPSIIIRYPSGVSIEWKGPVDMAQLKALVH